MDAGDGGLDFEDVLRGLDQQQVHAALDQADGLFAEDVGQFIEGDVGEFGVIGGGQFAGGTDGTGDETRADPSCASDIHPPAGAPGVPPPR